MSNGTKFDSVAASELRDTQSEILDVKGADISELEAGRGIVNDNHSNKMPDVIGRITGAKKIFGPEDCDNERHKYYWNQIKAPYIYVSGYLFDQDGEHRSAKAAAAILKNQHRTDSPLKMKCSVEGGIVERGEKDKRILARTKIRGLALTFTPANNATLVEGLDLQKSAATQADLDIIKSYVPLATDKVPTLVDFSRHISSSKIKSNVNKINKLTKALKAGYGGAGSPTDRTGGAVLQAEAVDTGKTFKYINCDNCGKEQPYVKYQVKCRGCNKSFNFDTLAKFFINK